MSERYIISIDQSTQGTKALLFGKEGRLRSRVTLPHRQLVDKNGWVSHNPVEIYHNVLEAVKQLIDRTGVDRDKIAGIGISNQRETAMAWNARTGQPYGDAIVWQCARAAGLCERVKKEDRKGIVHSRTGIPVSPYFPAGKIAWILENNEAPRNAMNRGDLCVGTIDSWLLFCLTKGKSYKTDYSNASRTQLFNVFSLKWDEEICGLFGIRPDILPEVCDSDAYFGNTDFEGYLPNPVPVHSVLGDSHGALLGQGCLSPGMTKATYGTGSSIMMNIGERPILSTHGLVTSLAWKMGGRVSYVLEGNLNYTGAVITWMKDDLHLISSPEETEFLARTAADNDSLYLVPAFTGLGAPYWDNYATAAFVGMTRTTRRPEMVRAGLECIAYQITDIMRAMSADSGVKVQELRVDGGASNNEYLMQFQSDIADTVVKIPDAKELSGIGAAYAAGLALGMWGREVFETLEYRTFAPRIVAEERSRRYGGWKGAVEKVLS